LLGYRKRLRSFGFHLVSDDWTRSEL